MLTRVGRSIMKFVISEEKIREIRQLRRTYMNWFSIWLSEYTKRKVARFELRSNVKINVNGSQHHTYKNAIGLARLIDLGWRITDVDEQHVVLQDSQSPIRMKARTNIGADLSFLGFVFAGGFYGTDFLGKTIVEAGAYIGDTAVYFAKNGAARVISLEPSIENVELALENVNRLNGLGTRITFLQAALSSKEGTADFRVFSDSPNINRIASGPDTSGVLETSVKVRTTTLESIMRDFGLERINFLKLNCEGEEYAIIGSLSEKLASSIDEIYLEFHRGPKELISKLENLGFTFREKPRKELAIGSLRAVRKDRLTQIHLEPNERYSELKG